MPDRSGPEIEDLDEVFRALAGDVDAHSRAPGAERALRTAGRRRTTGIGAALVAVVAVVALVGGWGVWTPRLAEPAAPDPAPTSAHPADGDPPTPARLTAGRLNAASDGWHDRWEDSAASADPAAPCVIGGSDLGFSTASATRFHDPSSSALLQRRQFRSIDDSNLAMRALMEAVEACPQLREQHFHDVTADLEVVYYTWRTAKSSGGVWTVNYRDRLDELRFAGGAIPSDDVIGTIAEALAADVQVG